MSPSVNPVFAARLDGRAEGIKEVQRWKEEAQIAHAQVRTWRRRHQRLGLALTCAVIGGLAVSASLAIALLVVRGRMPAC